LTYLCAYSLAALNLNSQSCFAIYRIQAYGIPAAILARAEQLGRNFDTTCRGSSSSSSSSSSTNDSSINGYSSSSSSSSTSSSAGDNVDVDYDDPFGLAPLSSDAASYGRTLDEAAAVVKLTTGCAAR
jgi:hypothetical protein